MTTVYPCRRCKKPVTELLGEVTVCYECQLAMIDWTIGAMCHMRFGSEGLSLTDSPEVNTNQPKDKRKDN